MTASGADSAPTVTAVNLLGEAAAPPALSPMSSSRLPRLSVAIDKGASLPEGSDLVAVDVLGEGGMGRVLLGQQRSLGREVALKTLRPGRGDAEDAAALLREARITGALEHPNIIPVHALGLDEQGQPVLVMKRVDGVSLGALLRSPGHEGWGWLERATGASDRLSASIEVLVRVATALEFAHERGVVHRDIKPDNILVGRFGEVYLADWGVAVRTTDPHPHPPIAGTPAYMAPEMTRAGGPAQTASDIYLLGATLHELLTGRRRHEGATAADILEAAARSGPLDYGPEVPRALAQLCNAATSADPASRPASAAIFRQALLDHLHHAAAERLTREAAERLDALRQRLAAGEGEGEQGQGLHRAMVECRFAFEMALREWPASREAAEGLLAYLTEAARFELGRGNLEAARALVREMARPDPALTEALEALERRRRREQEQARSLEELARQHDTRAGAGSRAALVALFVGILLFVLLTFLLPRVMTARVPTTGDLIKPNLAILVLLSAVTLVWRRRLLINAVNRRFVAVMFLSVSSMLVHRLLAFARGQHEIRGVLGDDLLLLAVLMAIGTTPLGRLAPLLALPPLVGAALLSAGPPRPLMVFGSSVGVTLLLLLLLNLRQRPSAPPADQAPRAGGPQT